MRGLTGMFTHAGLGTWSCIHNVTSASHLNKCDRISLGWLHFILFHKWMWDACYKKFMYLCHCFHLQKKLQPFARRSIDNECSRHGSYCKCHCSGLHYYERRLQIPRTYLDHSPRRLNSDLELVWTVENTLKLCVLQKIVHVSFYFRHLIKNVSFCNQCCSDQKHIINILFTFVISTWFSFVLKGCFISQVVKQVYGLCQKMEV